MGALDAATMRKLMADIGGEPDVMLDLVQTFLEEAPRLVASLEGSLQGEGDRRTLNRVAHSLKSTSATFGANDLSRLCRDLEKASEEAWPPNAAARVREIVEEWARVRAELQAWKP